MRKYVEAKYEVPNKNYLADIEDFERSRWVMGLVRDGTIEPTMDQLADFCYYCCGTYAILAIHLPESVQYRSVLGDDHIPGSIEYYYAFLAPAEPNV